MDINNADNQAITVTPNPVKDWLHIEQSAPGDEIIVYDYTGKVVLKENLVGSSTMLSASTLSAGLYIVRINQEVWKLVKIK